MLIILYINALFSNSDIVDVFYCKSLYSGISLTGSQTLLLLAAHYVVHPGARRFVSHVQTSNIDSPHLKSCTTKPGLQLGTTEGVEVSCRLFSSPSCKVCRYMTININNPVAFKYAINYKIQKLNSLFNEYKHL